MSPSPLDIGLLLVLASAALRGALRGFVAEAAAIASVVCGAAAAALLSGRLSPWVARLLGPSIWSGPLAALALFVLGYLAVALVGSGLRSAVESVGLEGLDRALGFVLGALEGLLVAAAVVIILRIQPLFDAEGLLQSSGFARFLLPLLGATAESLGWTIGV